MEDEGPTTAASPADEPHSPGVPVVNLPGQHAPITTPHGHVNESIGTGSLISPPTLSMEGNALEGMNLDDVDTDEEPPGEFDLPPEDETYAVPMTQAALQMLMEGPLGPQLAQLGPFGPTPMFQVYDHPQPDSQPCSTFFGTWRDQSVKNLPYYPSVEASDDFLRNPKRLPLINEPGADIQGLDWNKLGTDKQTARKVRRMLVRNHTNMLPHDSDRAALYGTPAYAADFRNDFTPEIASIANFFRWRQTSTKPRPIFGHLQLRHNLSASSSNCLFFVSDRPDFSFPSNPGYNDEPTAIWRLEGASNTLRDVIKVKSSHSLSCVSAHHGVLVAGLMHSGSYVIKSMDSCMSSAPGFHVLNEAGNGAVNHVETTLQRRSGLPQAVFSDNDEMVTAVDCPTNRVISKHPYPSAVNCSATSPDGRLRILVSDDVWPLVVDADTGQTLATLPDHKDHGFACAWSPDGITMATGHQDGIIQIWDARHLKRCKYALPAETSGVRSLAFSPLGSGYPVLVMSENFDFVSVVDARTFHTKQNIDFFGDVSGFSISPDDGRTLFVGVQDPTFGGIMQFDRSGEGRDADGWIQGQRLKKKWDLSAEAKFLRREGASFRNRYGQDEDEDDDGEEDDEGSSGAYHLQEHDNDDGYDYDDNDDNDDANLTPPHNTSLPPYSFPYIPAPKNNETHYLSRSHSHSHQSRQHRRQRPHHDDAPTHDRRDFQTWSRVAYDWVPEEELDSQPQRVPYSRSQRRRRGLRLGGLVV